MFESSCLQNKVSLKSYLLDNSCILKGYLLEFQNETGKLIGSRTLDYVVREDGTNGLDSVYNILEKMTSRK